MENYLYYDAEKNIQIVSGEIGGFEEIEFGNNIYIGPQCSRFPGTVVPHTFLFLQLKRFLHAL